MSGKEVQNQWMENIIEHGRINYLKRKRNTPLHWKKGSVALFNINNERKVLSWYF